MNIVKDSLQVDDSNYHNTNTKRWSKAKVAAALVFSFMFIGLGYAFLAPNNLTQSDLELTNLSTNY